MLLAISFKSIVLPAFGGATISPLCPKPTGEIKSIIRVEKFFGEFQASFVIWIKRR